MTLIEQMRQAFEAKCAERPIGMGATKGSSSIPGDDVAPEIQLSDFIARWSGCGSAHTSEYFEMLTAIVKQRDALLDAVQITSSASPVQRDLNAMPDDKEVTITFTAADLKQIRAAILFGPR